MSLRTPTDRKSTRLNSSHPSISYAVFCLKKKNLTTPPYIGKIEEPIIKAFVICTNEYIGYLWALLSEKRGTVDHNETLDSRLFFFNDTPTTEIYTLSLHDALPISTGGPARHPAQIPRVVRRPERRVLGGDRKSTRLNSSHPSISYAVFCLKKK